MGEGCGAGGVGVRGGYYAVGVGEGGGNEEG